MSEKLKPCPFCGGEAYLEPASDTPSIVICMKCGARGKWFEVSKHYCSDEKAIEAWNRRTDNA